MADPRETEALLRVARRDRGADEVPSLAEALRAAEADPRLAAIVRREEDFDRAVARGLAEVTPPAHLLGAILEAARGARAAADDVPGPVPAGPTTRRAFWRLAMPGLAAAAALALAAGLLLRLPPRQEPAAPPVATLANTAHLPDYLREAGFLQQVSSTLDGAHPFALASKDLADLNAWLASAGSPVPVDLPASLDGLPSLGCLTLEIAGRPVSMVCFRGDQVYHLFVASVDDFPACPEAREPAFCATACGRPVATWRDASRLYVLTADRPDGDVAQFF